MSVLASTKLLIDKGLESEKFYFFWVDLASKWRSCEFLRSLNYCGKSYKLLIHKVKALKIEKQVPSACAQSDAVTRLLVSRDIEETPFWALGTSPQNPIYIHTLIFKTCFLLLYIVCFRVPSAQKRNIRVDQEA